MQPGGESQESPGAFGALLRAYRVSAGLSQEVLAERAALSPAAISALEHGRRRQPHPHTVSVLANALGLSAVERSRLQGAAAPGSRQQPPLSRTQTPVAVPSPPTPLIGRETEFEAACALLDPERSAVRLLTMIGPGGVGKTRLAIAVADGLARAYADGVVFVDLSSLADHRLVAATLARGLGLHEAGGHSARELLLDHLQTSQRLFVLDNFEHLLGATALVAELLAACSRVGVLVTSRTVLRLRAERRFPVEPLATPPAVSMDLESIAGTASVRLFVERVQALSPDFALDESTASSVAALCRRLEGLPLAIELAAARSGLLRPSELLQRVDQPLRLLSRGSADLPERQRTLRATLAWSYDLLGPGEQAVFRRLAVFAGGWTLEAAESICAGADLSSDEVLDQLDVLVDSSLVQHVDTPGGRRFKMLDTVREYALERLTDAGNLEHRRRAHAQFYLALVEQAGPHLDGPSQSQWLHRLDADHANLRAALGWAHAVGEWELGLRMAGTLNPFWLLQGEYREGIDWLETLLAGASTATDTARAHPLVQARALLGAATLHTELSDTRGADHLQAAIALLRGLDQPDLLARALSNLATLHRREGELQRAELVLEEALELARHQGQSGAVLAALINLQTVAHWRGAFDRAVERATEALDLSVRLQDRPSAIYVQIRLASAAVEQADYSRAEDLAFDALDGARELALPREESLALLVAGRAARGRGETARSVDLMQRSAELASAIGHAVTATISWALLGVAHQDMADDAAATTCCEAALSLAQESGTWLRLVAHVSRGQVALAQADWSRAQTEFQTALGIGRECESTWGQPTCLEGLAALALEDNDAHRAARLLGAAACVRDAQGASVPEPERPRHELLVSRARESLAPQAFERAWAEGGNDSLPAR